jgi:hypothetical protein
MKGIFMKTGRAQKGFVLALSAVLLLCISVILAAFVFLITLKSRSLATGMASAKAFWLAEAGIQRVASQLKKDPDYRIRPVSLSGSLGEGSYTVSVATPSESGVCVVTSMGTVDGISRTIAQTLTIRTAGWGSQFTEYAVFAGVKNCNVTLRNNSEIQGDVYVGGEVRTMDSSSVSGTVFASSGSGNYVREPLPTPPVPMPTLTRKWYDDEISVAKTYPKGNVTYTSIDLTGKTLYVNGKVRLTNASGTGTIVSVGSLEVNGTIGSGVTVISDSTVSVGANSRVSPDVMFYGSNAVTVGNPGIVMERVAILSPGKVDISNGAAISGVVFADGNITVSGNSVVAGSVAAGGSMTLNASTVIQDKNKLPQRVPFGVAGGEEAIVLSDWLE